MSKEEFEEKMRERQLDELEDCFMHRKELRDDARAKDKKFEDHCAECRRLLELQTTNTLSFRDRAAITVGGNLVTFAMASLAANPTAGKSALDDIPNLAFEIADAMEKERQKRSKNPQ